MDKEKSFLYTLNQRGKYRAHDCLLENNSYTLATTNRKKKITEHGNQNGIAQLKVRDKLKYFGHGTRKKRKFYLPLAYFLFIVQ